MKFDIDESLLWKGKPKQGIVFTKSDIFMIPFSVLWAGFTVFWEINVLRIKDAPVFFTLWGIPFILAGIYITIGRFIHDYLARKNTEYFVTDKRVIIVKYKRIESIPKGKWTTLRLIEYVNGTGTILFAEPPSFFHRSGFPSYGLSSELSVPGFYKIKDAKNVMKLLEE